MKAQTETLLNGCILKENKSTTIKQVLCNFSVCCVCEQTCEAIIFSLSLTVFTKRIHVSCSL